MTERVAGALLAGRYRVVRTLGSGGMGSVYLVRHELTHHERALKLLHAQYAAQPEVVERFLREASAAGRIGNAHIVETFDAGYLESGEPYLVMEYLHGEVLTQLLRRAGHLEVGEACALMLQLCNALSAAHAAGVIHRDLKPDNVFVERRAGVPFLKVLDFGLAKIVEVGAHELTSTGVTMGTPLYMSPEQMRGARDVDARTDVYALGVLLYELLTGSPPYEASTFAELAVAVLAGQAPLASQKRATVPVELARVVAQAMAVDKAQRTPSVAMLARGLEAFAGDVLAQTHVPVAAPTLEDTMVRPRPRRFTRVALASGVLLLGGGAVVAQWFLGDPVHSPRAREVFVDAGPVSEPVQTSQTTPDASAVDLQPLRPTANSSAEDSGVRRVPAPSRGVRHRTTRDAGQGSDLTSEFEG